MPRSNWYIREGEVCAFTERFFLVCSVIYVVCSSIALYNKKVIQRGLVQYGDISERRSRSMSYDARAVPIYLHMARDLVE